MDDGRSVLIRFEIDMGKIALRLELVVYVITVGSCIVEAQSFGWGKFADA